MFSQRNKPYFVSAIANQQIADEIEQRLALAAYTSYKFSNQEISAYLTAAMANKAQADVLANKLAQAQACLYQKANPVPAVAAHFTGQVAGMTTNVTINAVVAGVASNVTLVADSVSSITVLIAAWNLANPANTLTLASGNGAQIPTADIVLAGGAAASFAGLTAAKAAFDSSVLSAEFKKIAIVALCDIQAANDLFAQHDAMVIAVAAL
jgi:hypothetical protein